MKEINYDQENDNKKLNLVEIGKEKKPAITGPLKVLFLDDHVPFSSEIYLFAKRFVANNMRAPFDTIIKYGTPMECVKSNGSYATYFSIPGCKNKKDVQEVVSAINNADVIVCGGLSGDVLFNFSLNKELGPFAGAIAKRVDGGFRNVIRYNSKGDLSNYLKCFKELTPVIEHGQQSYDEIFKLIKQMQPKRNFIQNHKTEISVVAILALLGLGYKLSENGSPETSRRTGHLLKNKILPD